MKAKPKAPVIIQRKPGREEQNEFSSDYTILLGLHRRKFSFFFFYFLISSHINHSQMLLPSFTNSLQHILLSYSWQQHFEYLNTVCMFNVLISYCSFRFNYPGMACLFSSILLCPWLTTSLTSTSHAFCQSAESCHKNVKEHF